MLRVPAKIIEINKIGHWAENEENNRQPIHCPNGAIKPFETTIPLPEKNREETQIGNEKPVNTSKFGK